jgi:chromate reductase, NAD(P)H dehydrogenase (quinone)
VVISLSPGALGAFEANPTCASLSSSWMCRRCNNLEVHIGGATDRFDAEGKLTNASTRDFLQKFLQSFATWIERKSEAI